MGKVLRIAVCACGAALAAWSIPGIGRAGSNQGLGSIHVPIDVREPISFRLEASKRTFNQGEPILLRLTAVNGSSHSVGVFQVVPWEASNLLVTRDGHQIAPQGGVSGVRNQNAIWTTLQPGQAWAYQAYADHAQYYAIDNWGYRALPAGHYTIVAIPRSAPLHVISTTQWGDIPRASSSVEFDIK